MTRVLSMQHLIVTAFSAFTTLAAAVPVLEDSASIATGTSLSIPSTAATGLNITKTDTSPWPKVPWTYQIPGHSPQHIIFEEISPEDTGLDGQQASLYACDEIVRWLWANFGVDQTVDRSCVQKTSFNGEEKGHVIIVLVPNTMSDVISRELALDAIRSMEALIWRYGGHSLECEIWAGKSLKGRISISIQVLKATDAVKSNTVAAASSS